MIDVRCEKCNRLLYKIKLNEGAIVECKCPKCGEMNKTDLGYVPTPAELKGFLDNLMDVLKTKDWE